MNATKVVSYDAAAALARDLMRSGGDEETLRRAINEAAKLAPKGPERDHWNHMADILDDGRTIRTKEQ